MRLNPIRVGRWLPTALAVLGLAGCGTRAYEDAARDVATAISAGDLVVHDSVSNFAQDSGRTVRFAVAGDPIATVPLHFVRPGACQDGASCADVLRRNLAYAQGQSAFAARLARAFAPCGFRGASAFLQNAGREPRHQFVEVRMALDRPAGSGEAARTTVAPCADALAAEVGGRAYAPDDVADWAARPVQMVIYLNDLSDLPEPAPPLLIGWEESLRRAGSDGRAVIEAYLENGRADLTESPI